MKSFHVCTIVNDAGQYHSMCLSFAQSGFSELNTRFTVFDNIGANRYEPYSALNDIRRQTQEPYLIFCHQDVRLDQGDGHDQLIVALTNLEKKDPKWAVAGNAGFTWNCLPKVRISDPQHGQGCRVGCLPHKVVSLDENFLVIRIDADVGCSDGLSGFHLYATDLCLNAAMSGRSAYVIDFLVSHLSSGNATTNDFYECRELLVRHWNRRVSIIFVMTPSTKLFLSRYPLVQNGARIAQRLGLLKLMRKVIIRARNTLTAPRA